MLFYIHVSNIWGLNRKVKNRRRNAVLMAEISNNMEEYVSVALDIGEKMLISGAEISRVEDTIERICVAYGSVNTHVFTV
ncbi:MAG: threonine/serine exporter family protein, partial [Oscillospiraceae bacterium]